VVGSLLSQNVVKVDKVRNAAGTARHEDKSLDPSDIWHAHSNNAILGR